MRKTAGAVDTQRMVASLGSGVVYTCEAVSADPATAEADTTAQDSLNAAV